MSIDIKDIEKRIASMRRSAADGQMIEAVTRLREVADLVRAPWQLRERLTALADNYDRLSGNALAHGLQPFDKEYYESLRGEALELGSLLLREAHAAETPSLYFSTMRFERSRPQEGIGRLIDDYLNALGASADVRQTEDMEKRIFNRVWTTYPLSRADVETLDDAIVKPDSRMPLYMKRLLVSALLLGAIEWPDRERALLLARAYAADPDGAVGVTALVALVVALMSRPADYRSAADLADRITGAVAKRDADLRMVYMMIARAYDTERIDRKMRDEVMPELMKLKPEIDKRLSDLTRDADFGSLEENPEWDDMMSRSGLTDKLREMSELQQEGADVMMSTFSSLKSFPFFNDPANWFMPFHTGHSVARGAGEHAVERLSKLVQSMPMLCDSDKFSLLLLTGHMGGTGFTNMLNQLDEQADQLNEEAAAELDAASKERGNMANRYVQDIYRFYKLFRRKGEFTDPFRHGPNPVGVPLLDAAFAGTPDDLTLAAEFLLRRGHHVEALPLLQAVAERTMPTAELYQKIGYALQRAGRNDEALEMYQNSDLLQGDSVWTLRRIASLLRAAGRSVEAAGYLRRAEKLAPENVAIATALGGALLEAGNPREALAAYYKADFLAPSAKTKRPVAWCLLLTGQYDKCRDAYASLQSEGSLDSSDMLNLGHLDMIGGHFEAAVGHYADALAGYEFDAQRFRADLGHDTPALLKAGVDPMMINIAAEAAEKLSASRGAHL